MGMSYPSGLASYGDQHPLGPASPTPSPASREMLRGKFCPPTKTTPPPDKDYAAQRTRETPPTPSPPPPTFNRIQKNSAAPAALCKLCSKFTAAQGTTRTPVAMLPPPKSMSPSTPTGTQQVLGRGWGRAHPSPTDAHAGGVEPPPHPSVGPWATCVSPTCVAQPEGTSGDPVMAAERGGGTAACTQIWSCRGEPGEREGKWGGRGRGGGEAGKLIRKGEKKKAMCPLPAVPPPPLTPPSPGGARQGACGVAGEDGVGGVGGSKAGGGVWAASAACHNKEPDTTKAAYGQSRAGL